MFSCWFDLFSWLWLGFHFCRICVSVFTVFVRLKFFFFIFQSNTCIDLTQMVQEGNLFPSWEFFLVFINLLFCMKASRRAIMNDSQQVKIEFLLGLLRNKRIKKEYISRTFLFLTILLTEIRKSRSVFEGFPSSLLKVISKGY